MRGTTTTAQSRESLLHDFVTWAAAHITGDEKGQAQIFLDRLFRAFGQKGSLDVGGTAEMRIRKASEDGGGTSFADYVWKPVVLIEMKKRGADLSKHYRQAFDYWVRLVPDRPQYVVLCNFDEFWVYDFNTQLDSPKDKVKLAELSTRWGPLAFLFPTNEPPKFGNDREAVTREAADKLALCFKKLVIRKVERPLAQRFILQTLVALFAEDIGLLPRYLFAGLLEDCEKPSDSYDLLGGLFDAMNTDAPHTGGRYKGVRYFNGGIFSEPARIELYPDELAQLRGATQSDWSKVSPEIFGAIFQDSMEAEERHAFGAHYTSPVDIMKIVKPTISDPWSAAIDSAKSVKRLNELLSRLARLRVLDPACGSGNFLYLAYREMKRLETRIRERLADEFPGSQPFLDHVNARQFFGMDINAFAIELAKVSLMIGRKLAIDELHIADEKDLPLDNLDANFKAIDSLVTKVSESANGDEESAIPTPWFPADVIIGNPPFLDARRMTKAYGRPYVATLERLYPEVPRRADHCTYWFRRAADHLSTLIANDPFSGRAGLVGTQNIRNNESRVGGLDHVVKTGTILDAVENQPWSGDAVVHVSIVNWVKTRDPALVPTRRRLWTAVEPNAATRKVRRRGQRASNVYELRFRDAAFINSSLSDATDVSGAKALAVNRVPKRCFEGQQPGHTGFRLDRDEYERLIAADAKNAAVIFPYMGGDDLVAGKYTTEPQFIIDFGEMDMPTASQFKQPFALLQERVLPTWQANATAERDETGRDSGEHQGRLDTWWQLKRRRGELITAIESANRYVACVRHTKRPIFSFLASNVRPDSALTCFTFADDYSFGILQSGTHWLWFITKCSKLKSDFRYTPDTVFDTFPWPQSPTSKQIEAVASAAASVRRVRGEALKVTTGGLRAVYRTLELPGKHPLKDAHAALDAAVLAAYGFDAKKDLLAQLLELNLAVAAREKAGEPVTAPGVPPGYGQADKLVTEDCIKP
jgi:SAM-dependent methyltransferase